MTESVRPDVAERTEGLLLASAGVAVPRNDIAQCDHVTSVEALETLRAAVIAYNGVEHARMAAHRQAIWDLLLR